MSSKRNVARRVSDFGSMMLTAFVLIQPRSTWLVGTLNRPTTWVKYKNFPSGDKTISSALIEPLGRSIFATSASVFASSTETAAAMFSS